MALRKRQHNKEERKRERRAQLALKKARKHVEVRRVWENAIANQIANPLKAFFPVSLSDVQDVLKEAAIEGVKVKAVGSGHAYSCVATTSDYLVETHGLCEILTDQHLKNNGQVLRNPALFDSLIEVEAGIVTEDLNEYLTGNNKALTLIGDYDQQTIVGAMSTATHGSQVGLGPMCDMIQSLVLVSEEGKTYRIEPANGITDPAKYNDPHIELVQDDKWFYSTIVSMGCFGIIYSVVLKVRPDYWVSEVKEFVDYEVLRELFFRQKLYNNSEYIYVDALVNPYKVDGKRMATITTRKELPAKPAGLMPKDRHRNILGTMVGGFEPFAQALGNTIVNNPAKVPNLLNLALKGMEDKTFFAKSVEAMVTMDDLKFEGYATEIAVSADKAEAALDAWFDITEQIANKYQLYQTSPMSLRFVHKSPAYMAPQSRNNITCMIEMPMLLHTIGGYEIMARYVKAMEKFDGVPHWGLDFDNIDNQKNRISEQYPDFEKWKEVHAILNKNGTFNNKFTVRLGLS